MTRVTLCLLSLLCAVVTSGCASTLKQIDAQTSTVDPGKYVVALSLDTSTLVYGAADAGEWQLVYAGLHWNRALPLSVASDVNDGKSLVMLESNEPDFDLGDLELMWRIGKNRGEWYRSTASGPSVALESGAVTYVGSVVIKDIQFDAENGRPVSVAVTIENAWDGNREQWIADYPQLAANEPIRKIAMQWANGDSIRLAMHLPIVKSKTAPYDTSRLNVRPATNPEISQSQNPGR